MQNGNLKYFHMKESYDNKNRMYHYVKCAICHKDFKTEAESSRVCDRCWADYEAHHVFCGKRTRRCSEHQTDF